MEEEKRARRKARGEKIAKKKHLTAKSREIIEQLLKERETIEGIGQRLGKSTSTISREIRKHAENSNQTAPYRIPNRCIHSRNCTKQFVCPETPCRSNRHRTHCSLCKYCNTVCPEYEERKCPKLAAPPYVCNGCPDTKKCVLIKKNYNHRTAQKEYKVLLSQARSGANISEAALKSLDEFVSPLIKKGQAIHHIVVSNPDQFNLCEKTLYRYVDARLIAARNYDLPRVIRMKPRKRNSLEHKVDKQCRIGRTYEDFQKYLAENPDTPIVEMDSVLGEIGGKVLLTFSFTNSFLLLAFIRDRNTSQSVIDVFEHLYDLLGKEDFSRLYPVILTDNGSEFSNPKALEFAPDGSRRTTIFYCDPRAAFQKPHVEVVHELIRRIVPKGRSFDDSSQADIDRMVNHINSYQRKKLNDRSAFQSFSFLYGQDILDRLGVTFISPNEIILLPALLK